MLRAWLKQHKTPILIGVIGTVAGGLILAGVFKAFDNIWHVVCFMFYWIYRGLVLPVPAAAIAIVALITWWLTVRHFRQREDKEHSDPIQLHTWTEYITKEPVEGVLWKFTYSDSGIDKEITAHYGICPGCCDRLEPGTYEGSDGEGVVFNCSTCAFTRQYPGYSKPAELYGRAEREIERRKRAGTLKVRAD